MSEFGAKAEDIYSGRVFRSLTDAVEKSLAIIGFAILGGDSDLFQVGRCRLIGEHLDRPAKPLTQLTYALHLLAGRVDAAPLS
jgi:hypothetical protein